MPKSILPFQCLLLILPLWLSGCGPQLVPGGNPSGSEALALEGCGVNGRNQLCGQLRVPEDPANANGRQIGLNVVVLPAIAQNHEPDPLFVLAGGPGEAATAFVDRLPRLFREINETRDLVFIDQRGTGESNPLDCAIELDSELGTEAQNQRYLQTLLDCLAGFDADVRFYTTPFAVDDFNHVRQALGYEKINLWGVSYGTRAALIYLRRHEQTVRSVVLDSVAPIGRYLPFYAGADGQRAITQLLTLCENDAQCSRRFPSILARTQEFIAELERSPRRLEIENPRTQELEKILVDGRRLSALIRLGLYDRYLSSLMPLLIDSAINGDFRPLGALFSLADSVEQQVSYGMHFSVLCAADFYPAVGNPELNRIDNSGPLLLQSETDTGTICQHWPPGILPDNYFVPVNSAVPTLLLSGELDPITPPASGRQAAETLSNSLHLVVSGAHHGVSFSGCVPDIVVDFIAAGDHRQLNADCIANIQPLPPFLTSAGPALSVVGESPLEVAE